MTKKSGLILFALLILTVGVIFIGQNYQKKQKSELLAANNSYQKNEEKEMKETSKSESFEENRNQKSVIEYLSSLPTDDEMRSVSFYGDFSESDEWFLSVGDYIKEQVDDRIEIGSVALPEFDSYRLFEENTASSLIEKKPAIVFFQVPVYGDQVRDISLSDSKDYTMKAYETIKQALPETLIVFVTPHPSSSRKEEYNSRTLDYTSYLKVIKEIIEESNLPLFDLHEAYETELQSTDLALEKTLAEDGKTLNNEGNAIYTTLFNEQLTVPIDTTSGK
ncbi:hypothetical protein SAMN04488700_1744 [Carnobacterium iners]|uniref:GDSL-like Lipase/Acylhydrolase n=1 Tax=Carnobacterium iners TaxID=1073423 RepID=A0A1X7NDA8_9LACT|nr:SGNH/GDSL hydrolase family protein [Carnobacterium iners]SEL11028.1 hypothetical protein SAMN04488114_1278 [Carnobacterium iners]SMH34980.1 hypothetical protein SAMN04488700_1744 [Carnobacterium iners]